MIAGRNVRTAIRLAHMTGTAVVAALLIGAAPGPTRAADSVAAVTTPRTGKLTICRNWLVYHSCTTYGRVALPERVAVGDKLSLTFGSNPKDYTFPVLLIRREGASCTILSDATEAASGGEKIEVARCEAIANPAKNPQ
jgi:hypothetical protein